MKIQAINPIHGCQPIKQIEFAKRAKKFEVKEEPQLNEDSFSSNESVTEQKYNLACRLAAFYKTQYENLLKTGVCEA